MKKIIASTALVCGLIVSSIASAGCTGYGSFRTCSDDSGNRYNINSYGNTTTLNGYNSNTGSTWNQTSQTFGNTTYNRGTAANGNSWNSTETQIGNIRIIRGTDSNGNYFNKTCTKFGCN